MWEEFLKVKFIGNSRTLNWLVVNDNGPALLERDWIKKLKLALSSVNRVTTERLEELFDR